MHYARIFVPCVAILILINYTLTQLHKERVLQLSVGPSHPCQTVENKVLGIKYKLGGLKKTHFSDLDSTTCSIAASTQTLCVHEVMKSLPAENDKYDQIWLHDWKYGIVIMMNLDRKVAAACWSVVNPGMSLCRASRRPARACRGLSPRTQAPHARTPRWWMNTRHFCLNTPLLSVQDKSKLSCTQPELHGGT